MASTRHTLSGIASTAGRASSPLPKILVGVLLLAFFVIGSTLHIQTSEAFFLSGPAVGLSPNWHILMQPWDLVQSNLSPQMAEAVMWGWGIELVFLICVVGFEVAHDGVAAGSRRMAGLFRTGTIVLILFDGYTDFQYGNVANGFWGQLGFALITAFVVFFFGTIGFRLIEHGIAEWSR
jgi:hypothetical protein